MKITLLLVVFIWFSLFAFAQDMWKVSHNQIEKLNTGKSDPAQNIISIKPSDLSPSGFLSVSYREESPNQKWIRYWAVYDGAENILIENKGDKILKLTNETLKDLFLKNSIIKIFTWVLPADPELAARIRVRRVHLCTLELKN